MSNFSCKDDKIYSMEFDPIKTKKVVDLAINLFIVLIVVLFQIYLLVFNAYSHCFGSDILCNPKLTGMLPVLLFAIGDTLLVICLYGRYSKLRFLSSRKGKKSLMVSMIVLNLLSIAYIITKMTIK